MPKPLRQLLAGLCFFIFGFGGLIFGALVVPLLGLSADPARRLERRQRAVHFVIRNFVRLMAALGFTAYDWQPLPPGLDTSRPFILIANHPSLIDTLIVLSRFPTMASVAKAFYIHSPMTGPMLRTIGFFAPGEGEGGEDSGTTVDRMVEVLRGGRPMVIFPEGTRSPDGRLLRFRRGACEAAIRAGVPIVPLFIAPSEPLLRRGRPWYDFPSRKVRYALEFFPVVDTAAPGLDPREVNRHLQDLYKERFARLLVDQARVQGLPPPPTPASLAASSAPPDP